MSAASRSLENAGGVLLWVRGSWGPIFRPHVDTSNISHSSNTAIRGCSRWGIHRASTGGTTEAGVHYGLPGDWLLLSSHAMCMLSKSSTSISGRYDVALYGPLSDYLSNQSNPSTLEIAESMICLIPNAGNPSLAPSHCPAPLSLICVENLVIYI